jgi:hypothetical protein
MRWALVASLTLLAAMAIPMARGRVHTHDDLGAFHLPLRAYYAERLAHGEPWDWMPQLFSGFYVTGEGQLGSYHPLHRGLYQWIPLPTAFELELWLSYPFMLAGTWLWLRRCLGRPAAALFGALLWTFSGFNLLRYVHPNAVAITAHVPWLLWAIDIAITARGCRRSWALIAVAVLTASQLLLGYPQYVWFSLLAEAAWLAFRLGQYAPRQWPAVCMLLASAKLLGLVLGAIQVLPTLDALAHSSRAAAPAAAEVGAISLLDLVQIVGPYLLRDRAAQFPAHEYPLYFGAVPLVLGAWLLSRHGRWGTLRPGIFAALAIALLALILAFGRAGLVGQLVGLVPLVGSFRCPGRYLLFAHLAMAGLASIAFLRLQQANRRPSRAESFKALWAILAISILVAMVGLALRRQLPIAATKYVLAGPLLLGAAAWLVARAERGVRWAPGVLVLLAAADLGGYGLGYAVLRHTHPLDEYIALAANPPRPPVPGDVPGADRHPDEPTFGAENTILLAGWRRADGYAGLEPQRRLDYRQLVGLQTAGVRWVRANKRTRTISGLFDRGGGWLEVPNPQPRIRMSGGKWSVVSERPGRLELNVQCPGEELLVVACGFDPGWQASVDGRTRATHRVQGDFLGCLLAAGRHRVVLDFQPASLRMGRTLSTAGLVLLAAWGFVTIITGKSWGYSVGTLHSPPGALY